MDAEEEEARRAEQAESRARAKEEARARFNTAAKARVDARARATAAAAEEAEAEERARVRIAGASHQPSGFTNPVHVRQQLDSLKAAGLGRIVELTIGPTSGTHLHPGDLAAVGGAPSGLSGALAGFSGHATDRLAYKLESEGYVVTTRRDSDAPPRSVAVVCLGRLVGSSSYEALRANAEIARLVAAAAAAHGGRRAGPRVSSRAAPRASPSSRRALGGGRVGARVRVGGAEKAGLGEEDDEEEDAEDEKDEEEEDDEDDPVSTARRVGLQLADHAAQIAKGVEALRELLPTAEPPAAEPKADVKVAWSKEATTAAVTAEPPLLTPRPPAFFPLRGCDGCGRCGGCGLIERSMRTSAVGAILVRNTFGDCGRVSAHTLSHHLAALRP